MKRILCIGDSNTFGYDPRSWFGGRYPADVRWTGLLERHGCQVVNWGQNGLSIPREYDFPLLKNLIRSKLPADAVTIMLGSNDLLNGTKAEEAARRMERLLLAIREAGADRILLIAPPVMQPGTWVQGDAVVRESALLAERYRALADRLETDFANAGDWDISISYDGVHFLPEGHAAFARKLLEKLAEPQ